MFSRDEAKKNIEILIKKFDRNKEFYLSSGYNETQTRQEFINPFFEALGWDVNNKAGVYDAYKDVIHEDKIHSEDKTTAPDYCFTLSGKRMFFVEAKKPSVNIKTDISPAYQVRRYGWSAKIPISIVTDFEEFAVYECNKKPYPKDNVSVGRIKEIHYQNYLDEIEFLWDTFSKDGVLKGGLDKYISADSYKKGTSEVDKEFLKSLDAWRLDLAKNIALRNSNLNEDEINYAVQQTIDRIIFLRICEDRKVEQYGKLQNIIRADSGKFVDAYKSLIKYFKEADGKYNSGIFDFSKDKITSNIAIDDKVIKKIINELYYPECPYEFSVLPIEILGNAYEQFLGKVIRLTAGHQAKVEEKPEVRKAGGVYYTPQYIVDYIVKNTVGKLIDGKTPDEISKIKICDPACGSGSFLIGAYNYLLDYHLKYYSDRFKSSIRKKESPITEEGTLTTAEKKRILINNIFGVDIDPQAVEVTKLSLLLKALEGETESSIKTQLTFFNERVLPTLENNIKCGNSLIGPDFYDGELIITPQEERKIRAFDWKEEFKDVFAQGGFDCVIGNPPYGAELSEFERNYLNNKFNIGNSDTAALFMVHASNLLKKSGLNGFIIPKGFTYASNWKKTRDKLLDDINIIVDCSKVWKEVKYEMSVYICEKESNSKFFKSYIRDSEEIKFIGKIDKKLCKTFDFVLNGISDNEVQIGLKIHKSINNLNDYTINQRGGMFQKHIQDTGDFFVLGGKQINRYGLSDNLKGMVLKKHITEEKSYITNDSILVQNIVAHVANPKPRIIIISTLSNIVPNTSKTVIVDTINQLQNKSEFDSKFLLGIINSNLISWYSYKFIFANAIRTMHFDSATTEKIPIPGIDINNKFQKSLHDEMVKLVDTMLTLNKELNETKLPDCRSQIESRIKYTDKKIDELVYKLYGLTEDEIKIVEGI